MLDEPKLKDQRDFFKLLPQAIAIFKKNVIDPFFSSFASADGLKRAPLRSEIYTGEQLEQHARLLAARHSLITGQPSEQLLKRLAENESILSEVHMNITERLQASKRIPPAAEWLIDNYYLIEEQIYTAKRHLPKGYSKALPQLARGVSAGLPRIYDIAVEIISHSDGHINLQSLGGFITAYQSINYLKLGELWAIPIMLRLALLENLRRLAIQISIDLSNKSLADTWAEQLIHSAEQDPKNLVLVIADMARSDPPMESSFVAELTRHLQEKGSSLGLVTSWLEQTLAENGQNIQSLVQEETQKQAENQVSISNSITSLRFLSTTNWQDFVEHTSIVEDVLRRDPAGVYSEMDFYTRDFYRHSIEKIAKYSEHAEESVANVVLKLAEEHDEISGDPRMRHVGYFLLGPGLLITQKKVRMEVTRLEAYKRFFNRAPFLFYFLLIFLMSGLISWSLISKLRGEISNTFNLICLSLIVVITISQLSISFVNWLVTVLAKPMQLPRMDYSKGIPEKFRTMVVIPTLLTTTSDIDSVVENLEVHYLANRNMHLSFGLLTDFKDAKEEKNLNDDLLLEHTRQKIMGLNHKYGRSSPDIFFLFHRPRMYNPKEHCWMGYERKRGKLAQLNALIMNDRKDFFSVIVGEERIYRAVKFIITLDSDTQLPRDAAWKMVATMAHPLNRPIYNPRKKRITEGYTILQPRLSNSLSAEDSSIYGSIHGNEPGTDPYTKAISDVYQDLFAEGSFIGKGIYDVSTFEQLTHDRFPDNRILSHDLLEGAYCRSGLIADVQVYELYPSTYLTDMQRRHRWIRGDWQILQWLLPFVPRQDRRLHGNPISGLSKWKIFDNLRRSLVAPSFLALLFYSWILSPDHFFWTFIVLGIFYFPLLMNLLWQISQKPRDVILIQHVSYTGLLLKDSIAKIIIDLVCLPYEAFLSLSAIGVTLWRLFITGRNLLQWTPYSNTSGDAARFEYILRRMWFAPTVVVAVFVILIIYHPIISVFVFPFLAMWFASPFIVWYISRKPTPRESSISSAQLVFLRKLSRKIWYFFETFVSKEDNWLPPDNYQEHPVERTAHRTSPTNIGLSLLANLSAFDSGYITARQLFDLTDKTTGTMVLLEKYHGHLYNWYDTQTLRPLAPLYISTVDSGNLAGHLITLRQGLLQVPDAPVLGPNMFIALQDEMRIILDLADIVPLRRFLDKFSQEVSSSTGNPAETLDFLKRTEQTLTTIFFQLESDPDPEVEIWIQKVFDHLHQMMDWMKDLVPWINLTEPANGFADLIPPIPRLPSLTELSRITDGMLARAQIAASPDHTDKQNEWLDHYKNLVGEAIRRIREILLRIEQLSLRCARLCDMEFDFLYDRSQHLLAIGYNSDQHRKDNSYYDLLASEARLTSFVGVAQGKLPQQSWFALGRQLTHTGVMPVLLSWSGSMFEYLMPMLVMPTYKNTLLQQTSRAVIQKQIEYGKKRGVPWGISESGYNGVDSQLNYQYHAFGVPGLGFRRGLGDDLVISPYSTVMALMVAPGDAYENLLTMKKEGFEGRYGFYEAIDYTPSRLIRRQDKAIVRSFMAHHQGMSLLSINYLLNAQPMQARFEADVLMRSTLLLLQERIPRVTTYYSPSMDEANANIMTTGGESVRILNTPSTPIPEIQLLSNGRYHAMVTNAGGGYSRWKHYAMTRWREDATCDNYGTFCYIRDLETNRFWSSAFQPTLRNPDHYEAVFSQGRAEFRRRDNQLETHTEIVVSPEDDIELRRVHITNRSRKKRMLEITSFSEVVLNHPMADELHPAFSNLFVQTEIIEQRNAILCNRRPRSLEENNPWMFHLMKLHNVEITGVSYETNRERFIGRCHSIHEPAAMLGDEPLSGSSGSVLDPVVSIRYRFVLEPYESVIADLIYGVGDNRDAVIALTEKYQDLHLINRVLELSWTHSQVILRQINAAESDAQLYAKLANSILYANPSLRADAAVLARNQRGQSGLWGYSISGDLPIVLVQIEDSSGIELVRKLIQAHGYWKLKGLAVDLVIWNEDHGGYRQVLQNQILSMISPAQEMRDRPGGIFVRSAEQISNEDRLLFQAVARIVLTDRLGSLEEQLSSRSRAKSLIPQFSPTKFPASMDTEIPIPADLLFFNGKGGFSKDGREYVIITRPNEATPAPWINILANPQFGSLITESGQSYTWIDNAHEFRLTPWNNDPVTDLKGEAFYLRDEESGRFWSPTSLPCPGKSSYVTRHGFGYSIFEHSEDGIETELTCFTDLESPVKYTLIKIVNHSNRRRRLSVTGYIEWVMGDLRSKTSMHVITEEDPASGAIIASNAYNTELGGKVGFFDVSDPIKTLTGDRYEFMGRNGNIASPDAMYRSRLSNKVGASMDPCGAIQVVIELDEGANRELVFRLGAARNRSEAMVLIKKTEGNSWCKQALDKVRKYWTDTLEHVRVDTPDPAINILTNGWLNYQTLSCRMWARSGFYQSGGAFGFRDQLQDVISLMHADPALARKQILLAASRQFKEGDVQHWWHPPGGRGVRTTCSDDFLWLPLVTIHYLEHTGDREILDESVSFLEGRLLLDHEESNYDLPVISDQTASLYMHCVRAIERGLRFGVHGLPLMGSGDWNDGMNKVGDQGKGESVWLAFFLLFILKKFAPVAELKNDETFALTCRHQAAELSKNIQKNAWDGEWFLRAFFDDGTPLGSSQNDECKIDSIVQSWSVLADIGDPGREAQAMDSAYKHLVNEVDGIIQLFNPAFDKSYLNPGYIKGYLPGVRENGGQYTHAAVWLAMAFAEMGNKEKTYALIQMLSPILHAKDAKKMQRYEVEPYVLAADVYTVQDRIGRGGWTWYTGSAGWMFQLLLRYFLGLRKEGNCLRFSPNVPDDWDAFHITYKFGSTTYKIGFHKDGDYPPAREAAIELQDDGNNRELRFLV